MAASTKSTVQRFAQLANRTTLNQEISALIRQAIANGELLPGERVIESKLARELGVSLTPVREAVRQLIGEGILTIEPNRGPSVRVLSEEDAFELYSLRGMLEGLAIRLAVTRCRPDELDVIGSIFKEMTAALNDDAIPVLLPYSARIHEGIVELSKHERLITVYRSLALQIAILNRVVGQQSTKQHELAWHEPVVKALFGGDPDHAERVIRDHIYESYLAYIDLVRSSRAPVVDRDRF
jgi:DNA-binding GntR family transcriptional regulator